MTRTPFRWGKPSVTNLRMEYTTQVPIYHRRRLDQIVVDHEYQIPVVRMYGIMLFKKFFIGITMYGQVEQI